MTLRDKTGVNQSKEKISCSPDISGPIVVEVDFRKKPYIDNQSATNKMDVSWSDLFYENEKFRKERVVLENLPNDKKIGFDSVERFSPLKGDLGSIDTVYIRHEKNTNTIDRLAICYLTANANTCTIGFSLKSNPNVTIEISRIDASCTENLLRISNDVDDMLSTYLFTTLKNRHLR